MTSNTGRTIADDFDNTEITNDMNEIKIYILLEFLI